MKITKIILTLITALLVLSLLCACNEGSDANTGNTQNNDNTSTTDSDGPSPSGDSVTIAFNGTEYTSSSEDAVSVAGSSLVIGKAGTYELSGTFAGQLVIDVEKTEIVELILSGVSITSDTTAPLYVKSADKCKIFLKEGTTNTFTDAKFYVFEASETKPNACIYSSDDLTINGDGALVVNANYNNGIGCKNDIKINGGDITVDAVKNAIKGNGSVKITDGKITVTDCADGIKSDSTDAGKGTVTIEGGEISIVADDDGIQAEQAITISGGKVEIDAYGKNINCKNEDPAAVSIAEGCLIEK